MGGNHEPVPLAMFSSCFCFVLGCSSRILLSAALGRKGGSWKRNSVIKNLALNRMDISSTSGGGKA